jgi:hypothetical protein
MVYNYSVTLRDHGERCCSMSSSSPDDSHLVLGGLANLNNPLVTLR